MCINIDDIHQNIIFLVPNISLTRDNGDYKDAMMDPDERSHDNKCIDQK